MDIIENLQDSSFFLFYFRNFICIHVIITTRIRQWKYIIPVRPLFVCIKCLYNLVSLTKSDINIGKIVITLQDTSILPWLRWVLRPIASGVTYQSEMIVRGALKWNKHMYRQDKRSVCITAVKLHYKLRYINIVLNGNVFQREMISKYYIISFISIIWHARFSDIKSGKKWFVAFLLLI